MTAKLLLTIKNLGRADLWVFGAELINEGRGHLPAGLRIRFSYGSAEADVLLSSETTKQELGRGESVSVWTQVPMGDDDGPNVFATVKLPDGTTLSASASL